MGWDGIGEGLRADDERASSKHSFHVTIMTFMTRRDVFGILRNKSNGIEYVHLDGRVFCGETLCGWLGSSGRENVNFCVLNLDWQFDLDRKTERV